MVDDSQVRYAPEDALLNRFWKPVCNIFLEWLMIMMNYIFGLILIVVNSDIYLNINMNRVIHPSATRRWNCGWSKLARNGVNIEEIRWLRPKRLISARYRSL